MKKIIIVYFNEDNDGDTFQQVIESKDLEEEKFIYNSIPHTISFEEWWTGGHFYSETIFDSLLEDHGIVGWFDTLLNSPECPDWIQNNSNVGIEVVAI